MKREYLKLLSACDELKLHVLYSEKIYVEYKHSGHCFLYAKILKRVNERLYSCLCECSYFLSDHLYDDVIELMHHLDVWKEIWDYEFELQSPKLYDKFLFKNNVNFPRKEVNKIISDLESLKASFNEK